MRAGPLKKRLQITSLIRSGGACHASAGAPARALFGRTHGQSRRGRVGVETRSSQGADGTVCCGSRLAAQKSRPAQLSMSRLSMSMMQAFVYKSLRKHDSYVFLASRDDVTRLPEAIRAQLGTLQFVFEVALTPGRTLARGNADVVRANLATLGFHVQLPTTTLDPMTQDHGTDA